LGDTLFIIVSLAFSSWLRFETRLAHYGTEALGRIKLETD